MINTAENLQTQNDPRSVLQGIASGNRSAAKDAAKEFEAVFLNNMLQMMFTDLEEGGTWGAGNGAEAWRGMLVNEYAEAIADAGGIGLASAVERELLALQEAAQ